MSFLARDWHAVAVHFGARGVGSDSTSDPPDGAGDAGKGARVRQLHTGNLYLFALDARGRVSRRRTSVRLEAQMWEMLYDIARREGQDVHRLAQMVQQRMDARFAAAPPDGEPEPGAGGDEPEAPAEMNFSSALRAFIACYFWKLSELLQAETAPPPTPGGRLEDALCHVSPAYLRTAKDRIAARRAGLVRRGRPRRRA
jgi:predicted DNA-binding ribbon-helix-helix protein